MQQQYLYPNTVYGCIMSQQMVSDNPHELRCIPGLYQAVVVDAQLSIRISLVSPFEGIWESCVPEIALVKHTRVTNDLTAATRKRNQWATTDKISML